MGGRVFRGLTASATVIAAWAACASPALATGNPVASTIKAQTGLLRGATSGLHHLDVENRRQALFAERRYTGFARALDTAATRVARAHPQTSRQRIGQRDWVSGVRTVARGFRVMASGVGQLLHRHESAGVALLKAGARRITAGLRTTRRGSVLLGLVS